MSGATVIVQFISPEAGGRHSPTYIREPYRPHFRVGDGEYVGIEFIGGPDEPVPPGAAVNARVRFVYAAQVNYEPLRVGAQFIVLEGSRVVGVGVVTGLLQ
jgi:translation elongation factor EF-Tu-like GTPase